jgi:hypothetical protein
MTEEEAKTKWCPFARVVMDWSEDQEVIGPFNRDHIIEASALSEEDNISHATCLASACMAWRWDSGNPHDSESKGGILLPKDLWPGHCGLAGKP